MNKLKRILCGILCGLLLLSMSGCSEPEENEKELKEEKVTVQKEEKEPEKEPKENKAEEIFEKEPEKELPDYTSFQRQWSGYTDDIMMFLDITEIDSSFRMTGTVSFCQISASGRSVEFEFSASPDGEGTYFVSLKEGYDLYFYILNEYQINATLLGAGGSAEYILI